MRTFKFLSIAFILSLAITACGLEPEYNLAFNPPGQADKPDQIFPAAIDGEEGKVNQLEFGGLECMYGQDKSITVARLQSEEEAIAFFKKNLLPIYQDESSNFSGTINGQYYAKAGGNWKLFGWVNSNYVFSLKASNDEAMASIIENFKFIEKK